MAPKIFDATSPENIAAVRALFVEYAASLGIDLSYQSFDAELVELPGAYARPQGRLLLAELDGAAAGCAALRPRRDGRCEMKRLYVQPAHQRLGLGRMLAERIITEARAAGYTSLLVDTLPTMDKALRLYESLGFIRCAPYFESPIAGNVFLELPLGNTRAQQGVQR